MIEIVGAFVALKAMLCVFRNRPLAQSAEEPTSDRIDGGEQRVSSVYRGAEEGTGDDDNVKS